MVDWYKIKSICFMFGVVTNDYHLDFEFTPFFWNGFNKEMFAKKNILTRKANIGLITIREIHYNDG